MAKRKPGFCLNMLLKPLLQKQFCHTCFLPQRAAGHYLPEVSLILKLGGMPMRDILGFKPVPAMFHY